MEMQEKEEPQALLDAGLARLGPVMLTVGATSLALFPSPFTAGLSGSRFATREGVVLASPPSSRSRWFAFSTQSLCLI